MTNNQKEALWWALGVILMVVLIFLVFAMANPACAQTANQAGRIDFVGRSLDKTVEAGPNRARTYAAPTGSGTRFVYRTPDGRRHSTHWLGPQFEQSLKARRGHQHGHGVRRK